MVVEAFVTAASQGDSTFTERERTEGERGGGGIIHLGECHKAKNMSSFPAGSCAFFQASLHYSSGQQIVSFGDLSEHKLL